MAIISTHACQRYIERINPALTLAEAKNEILRSSHAIDAAVSFGASCVRLGNGARLMINGGVVAMVKQQTIKQSLPRVRLKRFAKARKRKEYSDDRAD